MATQYRKRVEIAPGVYMNITKNGISTSVGVRSSSVTFGKNGAYISSSIPGTGFYNRQRTGAPSAPGVKYTSPVTSTIPSKRTFTLTGVFCAVGAALCMSIAPVGLIGTLILGVGAWVNFANRKKYYGDDSQDESETPFFIADAKSALATATDSRQKKILSNFIDTVETIDAIEDEEAVIESLGQKPEKNAELLDYHIAELESLKGKLGATAYDVDSEVSTEVLGLYENLCMAFELLLNSQKKWFQVSKERNTESKSSAASIVDLKEVAFGVGVFNYIKSKYDVPVLELGDKLLYLYPEFAILAQCPSRFEVIDYERITVSYSSIRFNEPGWYPSDAEKIGTTWKYVNKNGAPDKRFANNRQIDVVKYGCIYISVAGHFCGTFQISNAGSTQDFCTAFNAFACVQKPSKIETPSAVQTTAQSEIIKSSLGEIIQSSDNLFQCLVAMSADRQVIEALANQHQLDQTLEVNMREGVLDNRLAFVAANDLIKCFEGLGHKPDMTTDEGRAIGIILSRLIVPDNPVWNDEHMMRRTEGQEILKTSYDVFKNNLDVKFDPDKFLLIEIMRHEGVDEETVNRWAVRLYRYALLIAKADGKLSDVEQKWLTNILSFTQNGAVNTTEFKTVSKTVRIPENADPLFAEAARLVVSSNTGSISSMQVKLSIGYSRAGKIMDQLESAGVVGPANRGCPREVVMDSITLEELLNSGSCTIDLIEKVKPAKVEAEIAETPKKVKVKSIANPIRELEDLVGLSGVKTEINNIYNLIKVQKVRASKGLNVPDISYHCLFIGNPGTGKTTVARLVAQVYKQLGILSKGHLVETDRSGLVAEYVGQTAVKTNKIIDSALDGVLFIDEAYSLVQNGGGGNDFGLEAIATLLKRMEDNRDRLVVILAGYSDEMREFIESNPGLQSRFNRYIHFEDYTADELTSIFELNLSKFDYQMTERAKATIKAIMEDAVTNKDSKTFGNARFVRNLFEKTLERQAKRLASSSLSTLSEETLREITDEDIK